MMAVAQRERYPVPDPLASLRSDRTQRGGYMPDTSKLRLQTSDLDEAIHAVSRVYCPHEVEVRGSGRGVTSRLEVLHGGVQPVVGLRYSAPVRIDAGDFHRLMLMMTCVGGSASAQQSSATARWHQGQTLPLSPNVGSRLDFDGAFAQTSVRLDIERIEALCARRLNRPLDRPLRFELRPFSSELESAWQRAVELILGYEAMGIQLPAAAARSLDEFMMSLVLDLHPHNYSEALRAPHGLAAPRVVREAERMMRCAGADVTVSDIASSLGVSVRALEAGFREWKQATPTQCLRSVRLEAAKARLSDPSEGTSVTEVALSQGFVHLARFSAYYRSAFNENPSQTLRRAQRARSR
jgi:AraC-like DNA-binding protein